MAPLIDAIRGALDAEWSIENMAAQVAMGSRTFQRHFVGAMGAPAGEWLLLERIRRAKQLLEETDLSVDEVAFMVGFGAAATLRNHFKAKLGTSPADYRRRFQAVRTE
ncbi:hypothetical protein X737_29840 [Mesorhizobium sp. L48C026A00]|nr:hypothetical protein X737_29840 [Mesorhizobium sp. L48C026A00]